MKLLYNENKEPPSLSIITSSMTNNSLAVRFLLLLAPLSSLLFVISSAQPRTDDQGTKLPKVFLSIDCGSSATSYTDNNSIVWGADSVFTTTGETYEVDVAGLQESDLYLSSSVVLSTLRVFSSPGTDNCYTVLNASGAERVLVRASFFYGNYDNKSNPPTFNMYFNGNHWATVITSYGLAIYEAVFPVKRNIISVCLITIEQDQLPFMSALEIRSLDTGMYSQFDPDYPLYNIFSIDYGTNKTIRFPEDVYDRVWVPGDSSDIVTMKTSDSQSLTLKGLEDKPPKSVIETAIVVPGPDRRSLNINFRNLTGYGGQIYIIAYFSEVSKLSSNEKRSFTIKFNDEYINYGPIIPPYGSALEIHISNITTSSNTSIEFIPTLDSTLPPLLNAMQMFSVGDKQTDGTNSKDGSYLFLCLGLSLFLLLLLLF